MILPNKQPEAKPKVPHFFNPQGYGKAGNNAIDIMIAGGYFQKDVPTDLGLVMDVYAGLTKAIYKKDLETVEELKKELQ
jgi:hypothetical protein